LLATLTVGPLAMTPKISSTMKLAIHCYRVNYRIIACFGCGKSRNVS
jgi:hypothetical protein